MGRELLLSLASHRLLLSDNLVSTNRGEDFPLRLWPQNIGMWNAETGCSIQSVLVFSCGCVFRAHVIFKNMQAMGSHA